MELTHDQVLALLTAHPDTGMIADTPEWLAVECAGLGLLAARGAGWALTERGWRERANRLGQR